MRKKTVIAPKPTNSIRPRNAIATREAILRAALIAFSRAGYDGAGVREIAQDAGVTAMLVNRYFGSKEALFTAAVEVIFREARLLKGDVATLSRTVARGLVQETPMAESPTDPLLLTLRSAANPKAAAILRERIGRRFQDPLATSLVGPDAAQRAALCLGLIAGFQFMHRVIGLAALTKTNSERLALRLETLFQFLVSPTEIKRTPVRSKSIKHRA
jgi:AcrR family transcriptional regulator